MSQQLPSYSQSIPLTGIIRQARAGASHSEADKLARQLALTDKEMAALLAMNLRTFQRRQPGDKLDSVASERLALLKNLASHGLDVFEDQQKFNRWLRQPLRALASDDESILQASPLATLDTATGYRLVDAVLTRLEHGVF